MDCSLLALLTRPQLSVKRRPRVNGSVPLAAASAFEMLRVQSSCWSAFCSRSNMKHHGLAGIAQSELALRMSRDSLFTLGRR